MKTLTTLFLLLVGGVTTLYGQKAPLDHTVYDDWKSISRSAISPSGKYIYYTVAPQEGDGYTELKYQNGNLLFRADRGTAATLTEDEKFFILKKTPFFAETRQARIKKKKPDDMPKDSLVVYAIEKQQFINYGPVNSFKVAENARAHVVFLQEVEQKAEKDSLENGTPADSIKTKNTAKNKKINTLHIANLNNGHIDRFEYVDDYYVSPHEKFVVFSKKYDQKDSLKNDILHIYDMASGQSRVISHGRGTYKGFAFDDAESKLVFLADKSPERSLTKDFKVYYFDFGLDSAEVMVDAQHRSIPKDWYVSGDGNLRFDGRGERLLLGLAPVPLVKDTSLVDFEHAKVDIWHWQDEVLMTQQLANLKRDMARSYDAIYTFAEGDLHPLADEKMDRVWYTDSLNGDWALASSVHGSKIPTQWQLYTPQDLFLVSLLDGSRRLIREQFVGQAYLSPKGGHVVAFDNESGHWLSYDVARATWRTLNDELTVSFVNEDHDMPIHAGAYGVAGWSAEDDAVYINDKFDVWRFDLINGQAEMLTNGYGRAHNTQLRVERVTPDKPRQRAHLIQPDKSLLFSGLNFTDKRRGLFALNKNRNANPVEIVQNDFAHLNVSAAETGNRYIYTKENFGHSPDLYISTNFTDEIRLTDINPQQSKYNWGTAELVQWTTPRGFAGEGILYKPEDFDPNKKYPIIAYFYEVVTDGLHRYTAPAPTPSRLNIPYFVSNGYLVFCPDIRYEIGYPGRSAEEYVNSGMLHLAQNRWVDSDKMAIQGQSWGGYQVAHLITRTNMYAAAWAGAPVVNMTSAYGGIRWQTGMSRQFQYEQTQSRIGQDLWQNLDLYIENSPLFFMDRVTTPVAIMANDNDGAVPWYQGIEMFMALRRLGKPSWMLNYNNDAHNLMQRQNRKDIQVRQQQFFDHFLKGKPAATWISTGVSAKNKGILWGFD